MAPPDFRFVAKLESVERRLGPLLLVPSSQIEVVGDFRFDASWRLPATRSSLGDQASCPVNRDCCIRWQSGALTVDDIENARSRERCFRVALQRASIVREGFQPEPLGCGQGVV